MNYKFIYLSTLLLFNGLNAELNFEEGKKILSNIRNLNKLPENEIIGAEISIIENNQLSAIITCDTLISENYESSVLKGNVVAKFYQSEFFEDSNNNGIYDEGEKFDDENGNGYYNHNQCISQMDSDIAYYIEKGNQSSLEARRNVIVKKFNDSGDSLVTDVLSFVEPKKSEITWSGKSGTIQTDKPFKLESITDGSCMSGNKFKSNVDLTNVQIEGVAGSNYCK